MTTVGGHMVFGSADGKGADAAFNKPIAVTLDVRQRVLYVADQGNHVIRMAALTPPGHDMVFETLAGGWLRGNCVSDCGKCMSDCGKCMSNSRKCLFGLWEVYV